MPNFKCLVVQEVREEKWITVTADTEDAAKELACQAAIDDMGPDDFVECSERYSLHQIYVDEVEKLS